MPPHCQIRKNSNRSGQVLRCQILSSKKHWLTKSHWFNYLLRYRWTAEKLEQRQRRNTWAESTVQAFLIFLMPDPTSVLGLEPTNPTTSILASPPIWAAGSAWRVTVANGWDLSPPTRYDGENEEVKDEHMQPPPGTSHWAMPPAASSTPPRAL